MGDVVGGEASAAAQFVDVAQRVLSDETAVAFYVPFLLALVAGLMESMAHKTFPPSREFFIQGTDLCLGAFGVIIIALVAVGTAHAENRASPIEAQLIWVAPLLILNLVGLIIAAMIKTKSISLVAERAKTPVLEVAVSLVLGASILCLNTFVFKS